MQFSGYDAGPSSIEVIIPASSITETRQIIPLASSFRKRIYEQLDSDYTSHFTKTYVDYFKQRLKTLSFTTKDNKETFIDVVYGSPERVIGKQKEKKTLELPLGSIVVEEVGRAQDRQKYEPLVNFETLFDETTQRHQRIVSLAPKPVKLNITFSIWAKYSYHLEQLFEKLDLLFNPSIRVETSFDHHAQAYLTDRTDISKVELTDREDRVLRKSATISIETYIPTQRFLVTNTGTIESLNLSMEVASAIGQQAAPSVAATSGGGSSLEVSTFSLSSATASGTIIVSSLNTVDANFVITDILSVSSSISSTAGGAVPSASSFTSSFDFYGGADVSAQADVSSYVSANGEGTITDVLSVTALTLSGNSTDTSSFTSGLGASATINVSSVNVISASGNLVDTILLEAIFGGSSSATSSIEFGTDVTGLVNVSSTNTIGTDGTITDVIALASSSLGGGSLATSTFVVSDPTVTGNLLVSSTNTVGSDGTITDVLTITTTGLAGDNFDGVTSSFASSFDFYGGADVSAQADVSSYVVVDGVGNIVDTLSVTSLALSGDSTDTSSFVSGIDASATVVVSSQNVVSTSGNLVDTITASITFSGNSTQSSSFEFGTDVTGLAVVSSVNTVNADGSITDVITLTSSGVGGGTTETKQIVSGTEAVATIDISSVNVVDPETGALTDTITGLVSFSGTSTDTSSFVQGASDITDSLDISAINTVAADGTISTGFLANSTFAGSTSETQQTVSGTEAVATVDVCSVNTVNGTGTLTDVLTTTITFSGTSTDTSSFTLGSSDVTNNLTVSAINSVGSDGTISTTFNETNSFTGSTQATSSFEFGTDVTGLVNVSSTNSVAANGTLTDTINITSSLGGSSITTSSFAASGDSTSGTFYVSSTNIILSDGTITDIFTVIDQINAVLGAMEDPSALRLDGLHFNASGFQVTGLAEPTISTAATTKNYVDNIAHVDPSALRLNGANFDASSFEITGLPAPTIGDSAVNKTYADGLTGTTNLSYTASTRVLASDTGIDATLTLADASNPGLMTSGDFTKLAGIEVGADVTDAANVDAAGAVMNSDTTTASMSFVIDEDSFASDSATKVPTQQSVKAFVTTSALTVSANQWNASGLKFINIAAPSISTDVATKLYTDNQDNDRMGHTVPGGSIWDAESSRISLVATPTVSTDATNKAYVDTRGARAYALATMSAGVPSLAANAFNVSSVTDVGVGKLRFNFTGGLGLTTNAYTAIATAMDTAGTVRLMVIVAINANYVEVWVKDSGANLTDNYEAACLSVFSNH